jgi:AhpC/TSA family
MTLQDQLDKLREAAKARIPAEARVIMERSVQDLRASGIMSRIVKAGQPAPDFALPDADGRQVSLSELRARGPVALSFYRGRW